MGLQDLINKYDNGGFSKTGWFQLKDDGDTASGFCRIKVRRGSSLSLYLILRYRSNY